MRVENSLTSYFLLLILERSPSQALWDKVLFGEVAVMHFTTQLDQSLRAIEALDFTEIKHKLQRPEPHGRDWTSECCENGEKWYKRFLVLIRKYPGQKIVPNAMIDEMWHSHITDTRVYGRDCEAIFGQFVHHNPYFGMNGDDKERDEAFRITNELFRTEFGEDCLSMGSEALECAQDCGWVENAAPSLPMMALNA